MRVRTGRKDDLAELSGRKQRTSVVVAGEIQIDPAMPYGMGVQRSAYGTYGRIGEDDGMPRGGPVRTAAAAVGGER